MKRGVFGVVSFGRFSGFSFSLDYVGGVFKGVLC